MTRVLRPARIALAGLAAAAMLALAPGAASADEWYSEPTGNHWYSSPTGNHWYSSPTGNHWY